MNHHDEQLDVSKYLEVNNVGRLDLLKQQPLKYNLYIRPITPGEVQHPKTPLQQVITPVVPFDRGIYP